MLSATLLLIISQDNGLIAAGQRYEAFVKSSPALTAQGTVEVQGAASATITFKFQRGKPRMRFDANWPGVTRYAASLTNGRVREYELDTTIYESGDGIGAPRLMVSRISPAPGALMPTWLLNRAMPVKQPGTKAGFEPAKTIDGRQLETMVFSGTDNRGVTNVARISVDSTGRPWRIETYEETEGQPNARKVWRFTKLQASTTLPDAGFEVTFPDGAVPYALPFAAGPLEIGTRFPLEGWNTANGKLPRKGKMTFVAALGANCASSRHALKSLDALKSSGVDVVRVGEPGVAGAILAKGSLWDKLNLPATPVFFLVDEKGMISRLWMGFDPAGSAAWVKDVKNVVAGKVED